MKCRGARLSIDGARHDSFQRDNSNRRLKINHEIVAQTKNTVSHSRCFTFIFDSTDAVTLVPMRFGARALPA